MNPKTRIQLVAFSASAPIMKVGDPVPDELVLVPWGRTETRKGPVICDETTLANFDARQAAQRRDRIAGDFAHNTVPGVSDVPEHQKLVANWWTVKCVNKRGIVASKLFDTPQGAELIPGGHWPDISPTVERTEDGTVIGLHSFGWVRHGEMKSDHLEIFSADNQIQPMDPTLKKAIAALITKLGGTAPAVDAPDSEFATAIDACCGSDKPSPMSAEMRDMKTQLDELKTQLTAFSAGEKKRDIDGQIAAATAAGKKIGLKKETLHTMSAEAVGEYLGGLRAGEIPVGEGSSKTGNPNPDAEPETFSAEEVRFAGMAGVTPEEFRKRQAALYGRK